MRNNKSFLHCTAIAAIMLVFTACSNDENFSEQTNVPETIAPVVKGHPLVISASIGGGAQTRMSSSEAANGIKLEWEVGDKLYMLTSTDNGATWADTYYTFVATALSESGASKATFICDDFAFPEGTTKVKLIYTSGAVAAKTDLDKNAQALGEQSGKIEDIAKNIYLETEALSATSEEDVKNLTTTLVHANAVMKVVIAKSDIAWGDNNYAPAEITMQLQSNVKLAGTTDNTIIIKNTSAWDENSQIVGHVVVCMVGGEIGVNDRWIFSTKDNLGNSLIKATASAKLLVGGKRYNAPVTFKTSDYFPLLNNYFNPAIWENGTFDEANKSFSTGAYGFSGWSSEEGKGFPTVWNLSNYHYLVIKFADGSEHINAGANFRMFDQIGYFSPASRTACDKDQVVVDLTQTLYKWKDDATMEGTLDISNVITIGFWSFGPLGETPRPIVISNMYLTNANPDVPSGVGNTEVEVPGIDDSGEEAF